MSSDKYVAAMDKVTSVSKENTSEYKGYYCVTPQLLIMARSSKGTNREVDLLNLFVEVDPDGIHVLRAIYDHNEELRTLWLVKTLGTMLPKDVHIDIPYNSSGYEVFLSLKDTTLELLSQIEFMKSETEDEQ